MTASEAIGLINKIAFIVNNEIEEIKAGECITAFKMSIEALEKQIPKKPAKKNPICYAKTKNGQEIYAYDFHCPQCDANINSEKHHCPCGQALDWSDTE